MKKWMLLGTAVVALLMATVWTVAAQSDERGSIRGAVFEDVNGDGVCVNSGVAGEVAVAGVPLEFVSSDEATVVNLETGDDGTFGLVAAGQSVWRVTVKPNAAEWTVTSENPLYVPVFPSDGLIKTGINFCVAKGGNAVVILPESGAAATSGFIPLVGMVGASLLSAGAFLELRRRRA